jgi:hypothetical protein
MMISNPLPNILIMSTRPWRLDVKVHPLDTFHGGQSRMHQQKKGRAADDVSNSMAAAMCGTNVRADVSYTYTA